MTGDPILTFKTGVMRQYVIKKGNHYCSISIFERIAAIGWKVNRYQVRFVLETTCWWASPRNNDDNDLNKLTGISYGLNDHSNSVRLTWAPDFTSNGRIKIYGYVYDEKTTDPKFTYQYITSVQTGQSCDGLIEVQGNKYKITVNGVSVLMDNLHPDSSLCFRLYPYFGGNNTAPQDMAIDIEYL